MNALTGGIVGGIVGAVGSAAPIGLIAVGLGTFTYSVFDFFTALNIIMTETGPTYCMGVRLALDVAGAIFSGVGIAAGVRAWRASGSGLKWAGLISGTIRPGYSGPKKGWINIKPGDLIKGYNGVKLSDALSKGDYRPATQLVGNKNPLLKDTALFIYAVDENGTIWVSRTGHHPDLVNGQNVYGAGQMFINQSGKIVLVDDASGHYLPVGREFFPYLKTLFGKQGIDPSQIIFDAWR